MRFVQEAFKSNYIAPLGPQVDAFEKEFAEYVGIKYCVALSSGTAAMHLALRILGVVQADEVIASSLTFIGSVTPVIFQGANLVFVDCDRESWNMDPGLLEEELEDCKRRGKMPKAVVPTDLYGQCFDYERILEICEEYGVPVVADAAEALGAKYLTQRRKDAKMTDEWMSGRLDGKSEIWRHAGVGAKAAVFSFNGNKIITTSGGGMLASNDKEFIDYARNLSQQAREDFPHYEHTEIGYNYRMSNILAAIGRGQLKVLDERVERKREIFEYYRNALGDVPGIEFMPEPAWSRSNRWLTVILITPEEFGADWETVRLALEAENIEARPVWKPMHLQPVFDCDLAAKRRKKAQNGKRRYIARRIGGEVSEDLFERGLCLPSGTVMMEGDLDRVVETILKRSN
ncbi:MAG: aminotransferase class I/II-fold pyridoxal phosphate-dependent enzyme [Deltaproteobacteria bacterium]|jgi:dTDP-4-amino-4,6-dideoxygalactose transaminase|nr:aminotransferase class I/II-fold pyridoxal phosphate-dependent enzyme [Deltaproteobacteria bacterium]MDL1987751.1 aminotransferase class I/II-fold pyridoxal phosphate-dependent enzyme [Deltaproteobacteria bacterium]